MQATRGRDPLAGHPTGIVAREEHGDLGDVVGLAEAPKFRAPGNVAPQPIKGRQGCGKTVGL